MCVWLRLLLWAIWGMRLCRFFWRGKRLDQRVRIARRRVNHYLIFVMARSPHGVLVAGVTDAEPKVRLELLRALGNRGDMSGGSGQPLIAFARNDDDAIRSASCQALASLAGPAQIPNLIQLVVDSKSDDARTEAAEALGVVSQRAQTVAAAGHAAKLRRWQRQLFKILQSRRG